MTAEDLAVFLCCRNGCWLSELGFMGLWDFQDGRFAFRLNVDRIWARMPQISDWRGWYRTDGRTNSTGRFSLEAVVWDSRRDCLSGLS